MNTMTPLSILELYRYSIATAHRVVVVYLIHVCPDSSSVPITPSDHCNLQSNGARVIVVLVAAVSVAVDSHVYVTAIEVMSATARTAAES